MAGRLFELSDQVREAKLRAAEEKMRLQRLEQRHERVADLDMSDGNDVVWPTRPSILPVAAPIFSAVFSAQQRTRVAMGGFGSAVSSVTSANPQHLRTYVGLAQACNAIMEDEYSNLEGALARFRSSCSWASLEGVNILDGLSQLIAENDKDGRWVEQIAQAFEDAGGGLLSNLNVGVAVLGNYPADFAEVLLNGDFTMEQTAEARDAFVENNDDASITAFVEQYSFELAALNGIPFHMQHYAGKHSLEYALGPKDNEFSDGLLLQRRLEHAYARMGFQPGDMSLVEFQTELTHVRQAHSRAECENRGQTVQLVSFGSHDGAMTAGISIGDLDNASSVGVFTSGMNSGVHGLSNTFDGLSQIQDGDAAMAMVTWIGYNSPGVLNVSGPGRAESGAEELAPFLESIETQNAARYHFVVLGHSYGTYVVAEALQLTSADIDAFVSIASAGLEWGTTTQDLGVEEIYATEADADEWAGTGRVLGNRMDPRNLESAVEFSAEQTPDGQAVTSHYLTEEDGVGYMDTNSSAWLMINQIMEDALPRQTDAVEKSIWESMLTSPGGGAR